MEVAVTQYFQDIFTSVSSNSLQQVIQHVERVVSPEMNNILLKYFYDDKVKTALFQMHPTKALGPDSMNPLFSNTTGILSDLMFLELLLTVLI